MPLKGAWRPQGKKELGLQVQSNRKGSVAGRVGRAGKSKAGARSLSLTPSAMEDAPGPSAEKGFDLSCSFAVLLWLLCGMDLRQHTESKQKCWNIAVIH